MMNDNTAKKEKPIIVFEDIIREKREEEDDYEFISEILTRFTKRAERKALNNADTVSKHRIAELEEECMKQRIKLQNCIPIGILCRIALYAAALIVCLCIFITQIVGNYKILDYHILLVLSIAFASLLHTAVSTLSEWNKFLNDR